MAVPEVKWIDVEIGQKDALRLALRLVEDDGSAVLRGRGTRARRVLAAVMAQLPAELIGIRIPEPRDPNVTTLLVHPVGTPPPGWFGGDI